MFARIMTVAALMAALLGSAVPARAAGCQRIVTGADGGDCQYVATGAGVYRVRSISGYRVGYWRDGVYTTVAAKVGQYEQPTTGLALVEGVMPSRAGDIVHLSIGITQVTTDPTGTLRYHNGTIEGKDGRFD